MGNEILKLFKKNTTNFKIKKKINKNFLLIQIDF